MNHYKNGLIHNLPMRDYRNAPGLNKSALDYFDESPEHYRDYLDGKIQREQTADMLFGSLLHAWVLEKRKDWVVKPSHYADAKTGEEKPWNGNATVCKEWLAIQNKPILDEDKQWQILETSSLLQSDPRASSLFDGGEPEVSMFCDGLKGRADWYAPGRVVDIKTCQDASPDAVQREIAYRRYHVQFGLYRKILDGLGLANGVRFYFIFVEKSRPIRINVRELAPAAVLLGQEIAERQIFQVRQCEASGIWPGYSGAGATIGEVDLPAWAYPADLEAREGVRPDPAWVND